MDAQDGSYDLFLSYHRGDHQQVEPIARALRERGLGVFLDRWYLVPGKPWPQALEQALGRCRAVAVFVGSAGFGNWQQREKYLALDRQGRDSTFPVIPVLLPGAESPLEFLSLNTWVDFAAGADDALALDTLAAAARGQPPGPELAERVRATRAEICPFRGLRYFREEDAPFFFGRDKYSEELLEKVGRHSLIAVTGASGSGKSSVVRAGLLPRLRRGEDGRVWEIATLVPTDEPLKSLARVLLPLLEQELSRVDLRREARKLAADLGEQDDALRDTLKDILDQQPGTDRLLLLVDQWEELYTLAEADQARRFIDLLLDASENLPVTVVLTLRGDFLGRVLEHRALTDRLRDADVKLGPMTAEELRETIVQPADRVGLQFESGLEERILADVGDGAGKLPLLEFVLRELWEQRRAGMLHHEAYNVMGGISGAMAQHADGVWRQLESDGRDALRRLFLHLVVPGENAEDTRRRAAVSDLDSDTQAVLAELAEKRLLVMDGDSDSQSQTVEVAHEALIRNWGRLRQWLDDNRDFLLWRERLDAARRQWQSSQQWQQNQQPAAATDDKWATVRPDEGALLQGAPLAEAEHWQQQRAEDLGAEEREFIRLSIAARRRRQGNRWMAIAAAFVLLAGFGGWQYLEAGAERERKRPVEPTEMLRIEPGRFLMGAADDDGESTGHDKPQHAVVIAKPFLLSKYEVTFTEFDKFAFATGRRLPADSGFGGDRRPVINVSWDDAVAYAEWLSKATGKRYRLPTEAEWEYAARAGSTAPRYWGKEANDACQYANVFDSGSEAEVKLRFNPNWASHDCDDGYAFTAPVGRFQPNAWGLHDMLGNVFEWTQDCWHESYAGAPTDGSAWLSASGGNCALRVLRGGAWNSDPAAARSAFRSRNSTVGRNSSVGFRLAQDVF